MKTIIVTSIVAAVFAAGTLTGASLRTSRTQDMEMPKPGAEHAVLERFVGEWEAVTSGMGAPTKGKQTSTLTCGGMFLMTTYHGEFMGIPFEGRGVMGFDLEGKKYQNVWVDSMTPKMAVEDGTWDEKAKTLTFGSKSPDGSPVDMVFHFPDADHYTLRFVGKDEAGREAEQFKISYARQGAKAGSK
ncbi:MAG: DUF1579 family protein [Planctomycetota bacterium]